MSRLARPAVAALILAAACASSQAPGRLGRAGYSSLHAPYVVHYREGSVGTFVSEEWSLDSFAHIQRLRGRERHVPRRGPDWSGPVRIDVDGDGRPDDIGNGHLYDLRLRRADGALLWVRRVPIPAHLAGASLEELGRLYARDLTRGRDAFLGESLLADEEGRGGGANVRLVDEADLGVSGHAARGIVVRAERAPPAGVAREAYVLVRTSFTRSEHSALGERRFAVLLIIGYAGGLATPGEDGLQDLSALLSAIEINRRSGS